MNNDLELNVSNVEIPTIILENNFGIHKHIYRFIDSARSALKNISNLDANSELTIFSEDINASGAKQFILSTYKCIYEAICKSNRQLCLYENIEYGDKVKLHIDIDIKTDIDDEQQQAELFDKIVSDTIELVNDELEKKDIYDPIIIILKSKRTIGKVSGHIIYPNIVFTDITMHKYFFMNMKSKLIDDKIMDPRIYRIGSFRMCWNSKYGKDNMLEFYDSVNYDMISDENLFYDCAIKYFNLPYHIINMDIEYEENTSTIKIKKHNYKLRSGEQSNNMIPLDEIRKYVNLLSESRIDDYNDWINVGIAIYNSNYNGFSIWNEWSKLSEKYDYNECIYKYNSFKPGNKGIGSLRWWAKHDSPEKYNELVQPIDKQLFETIKINTDYLLEKDKLILDKPIEEYNDLPYHITYEKHQVNKKDLYSGTDKMTNILNYVEVAKSVRKTTINHSEKNIKSDKEKMADIVREWMLKKITKCLCIKAAYGSGKTELVLKVCKEFRPKRVLWICHRQTLSYNIAGKFKELGFVNYMDGNFKANRLICQIDSLYKIMDMDYIDISENKIEIKGYDLVVLDEIESLLKHFKSPTIRYKRTTFDLMYAIIHNSKKVLALDGDFSNRGFEYMNALSKQSLTIPVVVENQSNKIIKDMILTDNEELFELNILNDLLVGRNIAICSMSSNIAKKYYDIINKMKIKVLLHTSKTDDELKKLLKDANQLWNKYQCVIYSPCIDAGVDFNIDYFYKEYGILSALSTDQNGFLQMCSRIRKLKDNKFMVYTNGLIYSEKCNRYTFDEVYQYLSEMYMKSNNKSVSCDENGVYYLNMNNNYMELYDIINCYNEQDSLNSYQQLFIPLLIQKAKVKGYTINYIPKYFDNYNITDNEIIKTGHICNNIKKSKKIDIDNTYINNLLEANDIDMVEYKKLSKKQSEGKATAEDKLKIDKYVTKIQFGIDNITEEFLKSFYGKSQMLRNLITLIDDDNIKLQSKNNIDKNIIYDDFKRKEKNDVIRDIIRILGYDNVFSKIELDKKTFDKNYKKVLSQSKFFKNLNYYRLLFKKRKVENISSIKAFMGFVNPLLDEYGISIKLIRKTEKSENGKFIKKSSYKLEFYKNIIEFVINKKYEIKNSKNIELSIDNEIWNHLINKSQYMFTN